MKLSTLLIVAFMIISIVSTVVAAYYLFLNSEDALTAEVYDHLTTAAQSRAEHIKTYLNEEKHIAKIMANSLVVRNFLEALSNGTPPTEKEVQDVQTRLEGLLNISEGYNEVFVLDKGGVVIASSDKTDLGKDKSQDIYFVSGHNDTFIKDIYLSEITGKPEMGISSPIFDKQGNLIGVYVVTFGTDALNSITLEKSGLGDTGEIVLVNMDRYMLTPAKYQEGYVLTSPVDTDIVNKCIADVREYAGESGEIEEHTEEVMHYSDYRGVSVIGTHAYALPEMRWCLIAKIDESEAIGVPRNELFSVSLIIGGVTLLFIFVATFFISRKVSKQISRLTYSVDFITKGNLELQLDKSRISEVQELIDSLNRILASLKLAILRTGMTKGEMGLGEAIKAKEQAEQKYKDLFNNAADAMFIHDLEGHFLEVNDVACKRLGYPHDKFMSLSPQAIDSPKFAKLVQARVKELKKEGAMVFESAHITKDGREIPVEISSRVIEYSGQPAIISIARDISDRKAVEAKYKALFESSTDAIMIVEPPNWNFTAGNPAAIKMFNTRDEKEFCSLTPGDLSPKYQPDGQLSSVKAKTMIETAMKNGSNFFEWTHKRYNGEDFPATVLLTKVASGGKEFLQATVRDVSESKRLVKGMQNKAI